MVEQEYSNIFHKTIGALTKQTSDSIEIFQNAFANVVPLNTEFSDTNLSADLKKMAEVISVRSKLGANRQIFFTTFGGWDHHRTGVLSARPGSAGVSGDLIARFDCSGISCDVACVRRGCLRRGLPLVRVRSSLVALLMTDCLTELCLLAAASYSMQGGKNCYVVGGVAFASQRRRTQKEESRAIAI